MVAQDDWGLPHVLTGHGSHELKFLSMMSRTDAVLQKHGFACFFKDHGGSGLVADVTMWLTCGPVPVAALRRESLADGIFFVFTDTYSCSRRFVDH